MKQSVGHCLERTTHPPTREGETSHSEKVHFLASFLFFSARECFSKHFELNVNELEETTPELASPIFGYEAVSLTAIVDFRCFYSEPSLYHYYST